MSADPQPGLQPDPEFEHGLVHAFNRAAEDVRTEAEPLVSGGLAQGRGRRRRRRTAAITGSVIALAVIGAGGVLASDLTAPVPVSRALDDASKGAPAHLDKAVNILLIGLDSRKDMDGNDLPPDVVENDLHAGSSSEAGGYNADTLIVLHIPAGGGRASALSVPRDDYVRTYGADGRMHRIRDVYGLAKMRTEAELQGQGLAKGELERRSREAGRSATIQTVQKFLDIPIDHFAEFNLMGFYDIAKAVGPVGVCLNHPVSDPIVSGSATQEGGGTGLELPAGYSDLNAADALSFVRQRHNLPNGDLDRVRRQQAFIASALHRLGQGGVLGDPARTQSLFDAVKKDLVIDDRWNVVRFAGQVSELTGGNLEFDTLPLSGFKTVDGENVNTVDQERIRQIVKQRFGDTPAPAATAPAAAATASGSGGSAATGPSVAPSAAQQNGIPCVD
ncbi:LCP family protein [Kitasatospora sp. HPMI-4]|uniref:LCP family protein n=1 Tax=Kitasatospora sp. HPMI-4 TaxID=3448443 RepID=UPI003F19B8A9